MDDLLEELGLDTKPTDANDIFWDELTSGGYPKIHNARYWLVHQMSFYHHFREDNVNFTRQIMKDGKVVNSTVTQLEYGKIALKYYLYMTHYPRFNPEIYRSNGLGAADMDVIIAKMVSYEPIRTVIDAPPS